MAIPEAVRGLERDLRNIFGPRLHSLVIYRSASDATDAATPTLAHRRCPDRRTTSGRVPAGSKRGTMPAWRRRCSSRSASSRERWTRSRWSSAPFSPTTPSCRDPIPSTVCASTRPTSAGPARCRSAATCCTCARATSNREGGATNWRRSFPDSAAALAGLVRSVARLHGTPAATSVEAAEVVERMADLAAGSLSTVIALASGPPLTADAARRMFPGYLAGLERLTEYVDSWSPS